MAAAMARSQAPHVFVYCLAHSQAAGRTTHILLEPFPQILLLMQVHQGCFEEEYTTKKLQ